MNPVGTGGASFGGTLGGGRGRQSATQAAALPGARSMLASGKVVYAKAVGDAGLVLRKQTVCQRHIGNAAAWPGRTVHSRSGPRRRFRHFRSYADRLSTHRCARQRAVRRLPRLNRHDRHADALLGLPRQRHRHRQAHRTHPHHGGMRHLPHHHQLRQGALRPRQGHRHLCQLPRRAAGNRQKRRTYRNPAGLR